MQESKFENYFSLKYGIHNKSWQSFIKLCQGAFEQNYINNSFWQFIAKILKLITTQESK